MYGLINKAVKGFAIESGGQEAWESIRDSAKCPSDEFVSMQSYSDDLTYSLVEHAANYFNLSQEKVLHAFGRHWILFTANEGYADLLDFYGNNLEEFISRLDDMHTRLQQSMPHLKMPHFRCHRNESNEIVVDYMSQRVGLEPMVAGLLEGLGERFGTAVAVSAISPAEGYNATFLVRRIDIKDHAA